MCRMHRLNPLTVLAGVVFALGLVFMCAFNANACPQAQLNYGYQQAQFAPVCDVGCYQAQAVLAAPQYFVQPQQAQVFVQRQVPVYHAQSFQQSYGVQSFAAPAYGVSRGRVNVFAGRGAVGYGGAVAVNAPGVAVDVGRARPRFGLRFRLNRAANVGASAALGVPARAVR